MMDCPLSWAAPPVLFAAEGTVARGLLAAHAASVALTTVGTIVVAGALVRAGRLGTKSACPPAPVTALVVLALWFAYLAKAGDAAALTGEGVVAEGVAALVYWVVVGWFTYVVAVRHPPSVRTPVIPPPRAPDIGLLRVLESAWSASEDGIMVAAPKPTGGGVQIVYTNAAFERLTGYSSAEVAGLSTSNLFETDLGPAVPDAVRAALRGCVPARVEVPVRRKDRQPIWTEWQVFPVPDATAGGGHRIVVLRDITDKHLAETEARGSRDFVGSMLEHLPAIVSVSGADGRVRLVNPAWVRTAHVPAHKAVGALLTDVLPAPTAHALTRHADAVRKSGRAIRGRTVLDLGRGPRSYVTVQFLLPGEGELVGVVCVDVTDQARAEDALRKSEERYRLLFDCNPYPMWVYDEDTLHILAVNEPASREYGYTRDEFLTMSIRDISPAEDVDRLVLTPPPADGESGRLSPWRHRTKAGVVRDVEATSHRVRFGDRPARLIVASDITDRRRAERALRDQEDLLKNILSHVPCGVFWKDKASIYLGCNDRAARDAGLTVPGEIVGLTDYELAADPDEAAFSRNIDRQVIRSGEAVLNLEEVRTRAAGTKVTLLSSKVPLRDSTGAVTGIVGAYLDITEWKRLEEQFRQAQKLEAVGRLAGGIAHDFRNLLTVIIGNAGLLREVIPDGDSLRMVEEINEAADQGAGLVRQLLTFSRPQQAKFEVIDLGKVVADTAAIVRRLLGRVAVEVDVPPTPVAITADRGQVEQIVMNLAVNARDAMPGGGKLRIAVVRDTAANSARLSVSDTGCGMPDEVKAKIFDPFFTTKGPDKGTGLGLAVVQGIVKQAGGTIDVTSTVGVGTTFHIDFPRAERTATPNPRVAGTGSACGVLARTAG